MSVAAVLGLSSVALAVTGLFAAVAVAAAVLSSDEDWPSGAQWDSLRRSIAAYSAPVERAIGIQRVARGTPAEEEPAPAQEPTPDPVPVAVAEPQPPPIAELPPTPELPPAPTPAAVEPAPEPVVEPPAARTVALAPERVHPVDRPPVPAPAAARPAPAPRPAPVAAPKAPTPAPAPAIQRVTNVAAVAAAPPPVEEHLDDLDSYMLVVNVDAAGVHIEIDGRSVGTAPLNTSVSPGKHKMRLWSGNVATDVVIEVRSDPSEVCFAGKGKSLRIVTCW